MTSKTSFFNKGIYLSSLRRFSWGSVVYFVILFMFTGLNCILSIQPNRPGLYGSYYFSNSLILSNEYIVIPLLLAVVVPTVTAILIMRFVHSKGYAIFAHSLPVSRKANYISSVLAGLTLMVVPVILNGLILVIISFCGYGAFYTVSDCFVWIGLNVFSLFTIFSCAVLASVVTGNGFASVAVNALIHGFLFIAVLTFSVMAEVYIAGFSSSSVIFDRLMENNFVTFCVSLSNENFRGNMSALKYIELALISVIIYIAAYFLYRSRKIETASDVAGFKCLNSIFKYSVTFLATMFIFAIFADNIRNNFTALYIIILIISAVLFFGLEMLLKKTLKVGYAYKGYIGLLVVFAAGIGIFNGTGCFGYETRVPEPAAIESAALYHYYYQEEKPFVTKPEIIEEIVKTHSEIVSDIESYVPYGYGTIHIEYNLKNGMTMERVYRLSDEDRDRIMNKIYDFKEVKMATESVFIKNVKEVVYEPDIPIKEMDEFLEVIRNETLSLSYDEIRTGDYPKDIDRGIRIDYESGEIELENGPVSTVSGRYISLNKNYKKTLKWLEEKGYTKM